MLLFPFYPQDSDIGNMNSLVSTADKMMIVWGKSEYVRWRKTAPISPQPSHSQRV